jgi:chromosomal replication initiation ATPase DnaA
VLLDHPKPGVDWPEDRFFHLLNRLAEGDGSVMILSRQPMGDLGWELADLKSRLAGLAAVEITAPDDEVLVAVMQKHADDLGLALDGEVARYMSNRIERSFSAARYAVEQIKDVALQRKKKVNLAMARDILDKLEPRFI